MVFSTIAAYQYTGLIVSPGFIGGPVFNHSFGVWTDNTVLFNAPTLADVQQVQAAVGKFERLENAECVAQYYKTLVTDRSDLVLVSSYHNATDDKNTVYFAFRYGNSYVDFDGIAGWMCESSDLKAFERCYEQKNFLFLIHGRLKDIESIIVSVGPNMRHARLNQASP